jgi:predicted transcriptional regulator
MTEALITALTRRERHIMDILFRLGRATADEVMRELATILNCQPVAVQMTVSVNFTLKP